jgi:hypothetical protein
MPVVLTALMKQIGCALCCRVREQKGWPASPPKFWVQQMPSGSRCWMKLCVLLYVSRHSGFGRAIVPGRVHCLALRTTRARAR